MTSLAFTLASCVATLGSAVLPTAMSPQPPTAEGVPPLPRLLLDGPDELEPPGDCCQRSFLIPAIEVPVFLIALNLVDRILGKSYAEVTPATFWEHLTHGPWEYDVNPMFVNVVAHPYSGSLCFNFARSSGLSFWWSSLYAAIGSVLWELGGETEPPSTNDQIFTSIGGALIGEVLYRGYLLILPREEEEEASVPLHLAAFLVDPAAELNGLLFDGRFRSADIEERPPLFLLAQGGGGYVWVRNPLVAGGDFSGFAFGAQFELDYGQPADSDFSPSSPFNYFRLDAALIGDSQAFRETIRVQGLLGGWRIGGEHLGGVIGAFGSFDDVSAGVFRVSDVATGLGFVGELHASQTLMLRCTATLSGAFGAVNTRLPPVRVGYHLGPGAAAALDLRLFFEGHAMIELASSAYFISGNAKFPGHDWLNYSRLTGFVRLGGPHALGAAVSLAGRVAKNHIGPSFSQGATAVTLSYAWIADRLLEESHEPGGAAP